MSIAGEKARVFTEIYRTIDIRGSVATEAATVVACSVPYTVPVLINTL